MALKRLGDVSSQLRGSSQVRGFSILIIFRYFIDFNKVFSSWHSTKTICQHMNEWKTPEEEDQFIYLGCTQTKDGISIKEGKIRLAQTHSAMRRLAILWKTKAISFPTKAKLYTRAVLNRGSTVIGRKRIVLPTIRYNYSAECEYE